MDSDQLEDLATAALAYRDACAAYTAAHALETAAHDAYVKASQGTPLDRLVNDNTSALRAAFDASEVASEALKVVESAREQLLALASALSDESLPVKASYPYRHRPMPGPQRVVCERQ